MKFSFRRARAAAALTAVLALSALAGTAPAQAHDALASTSPAEGQTITTNPGKVSITLNNPPNTQLKGSNIIKVTAPDGHTVSTGELTVNGATLTTAADIDHPGKHTVEWRAVSADGHPIDGKFTFTFAGTDDHASSEATTASAPATAAPPVTTPAAVATETQTPETQAAEPASSQTPDNTGWFIGIGVVLLILVGVGAYLVGRRAKPGTGNN
ncbi:copper resistance CopC family protein [Pseudarthrobacter enclensis]|uniref:Methionine-rich copper-binding protein CopC n=1 Tax=Pseudarthrobacter enclensis TaxID=993070 RepID=A0ABT9RVA8_9MICC|nr:copper resistance CopC family protein [Pseudarthrobacter enclensis]MDP9888593.1 methionine-rich copper-binding protein CopC [Pseudarthrobacter enclensis]